MMMLTEEKEDKYRIPMFDGDKGKYSMWKIHEGFWEDKKKVSWVSVIDKTDELLSAEEYTCGQCTELVDQVDMQGNVMQVSQTHDLTNEEKKLYTDNVTAMNKIIECMSDKLLVPLMVAVGLKKSVYLVKKWLETNYVEVKALDSLKDLMGKLSDLHPCDFKESIFYLMELEDLNHKLAKIGNRYSLDELQLKLEVLKKIPDASDDKPNEKWSSFQSAYRMEEKLEVTTWMEFKEHLTREWKVISAPTNVDGSKKAGKALAVTKDAGSTYFPGPCGNCGKKGHKASACKAPKGSKKKGKGKSNGGGNNGGGNGGGNSGGRGSSNKVKKCYKCQSLDHMIKDCPKWKDEVTKSEKVEVALMVHEVPVLLEMEPSKPMLVEELPYHMPSWWANACESSDEEDEDDDGDSLPVFLPWEDDDESSYGSIPPLIP